MAALGGALGGGGLVALLAWTCGIDAPPERPMLLDLVPGGLDSGAPDPAFFGQYPTFEEVPPRETLSRVYPAYYQKFATLAGPLLDSRRVQTVEQEQEAIFQAIRLVGTYHLPWPLAVDLLRDMDEWRPSWSTKERFCWADGFCAGVFDRRIPMTTRPPAAPEAEPGP